MKAGRARRAAAAADGAPAGRGRSGRGGTVVPGRGANHAEYLSSTTTDGKPRTGKRVAARPPAMRGEQATSGCDCPLVTTG